MTQLKNLDEKTQHIDILCEMFLKQKAQLKQQKEKLDAIEAQIVEAVGAKVEGAHTQETPNFKIKTTGKITRSIDAANVFNVKALINKELFDSLFTFSPKLNLTLFKNLEETNPETYKTVATVITAKPAKTSLEIKTL